MPVRYQFTPEECEQRFIKFDGQLKTTPLPDGKGGMRTADAGEFMLMYEDEHGKVFFKHRLSRQYVVSEEYSLTFNPKGSYPEDL